MHSVDQCWLLAGTLAPVCLLLVVQAAILFTATAYAIVSALSQPILLVLAVLLAGGLAAGLAFVTAALTRSVDAATITAFPAAAALVGGGVWATSAELGDVTWLMLATGGGAIAELTRIGWDGLPGGAGLADSLVAAGPSLLAIVTLTTGVIVAAAHTFRWGPRD